MRQLAFSKSLRLSHAQLRKPESGSWAGYRSAHQEGERASERGVGVVGGSEEEAKNLYLI